MNKVLALLHSSSEQKKLAEKNKKLTWLDLFLLQLSLRFRTKVWEEYEMCVWALEFNTNGWVYATLREGMNATLCKRMHTRLRTGSRKH